MYDYVEGYCPVIRYRCLMPVEYEKMNNSTRYNVLVTASLAARIGNLVSILETHRRYRKNGD